MTHSGVYPHYDAYLESETEIVELYVRSEDMEVEEFEQLLDHVIYYGSRPWHPGLAAYRPMRLEGELR